MVGLCTQAELWHADGQMLEGRHEVDGGELEARGDGVTTYNLTGGKILYPWVLCAVQSNPKHTTHK